MQIKIVGPAPVTFGVDPLDKELGAALKSAKRGAQLSIAVAYAQRTGIECLAPSLRWFIRRGGGVQAVVGIDDYGTSADALMELLKLLGHGNVFVFHNPADATFHPKVYLLDDGTRRGTAIVGSSNLTIGGMRNNFEFNLSIQFDLTVADEKRQWQGLIAYFAAIRDAPSSKPVTRTLLRRLQARGMLGVEDASPVYQRRRRRRLPRVFRSMPVRGGRRAAATPAPPRMFIMTLAENDVSGARGDPYFLIPLAARDANPSFWNWPAGFAPSRHGGHMERRFTAEVRVRSKLAVEQCRLYEHLPRSEFRFKCETVYRLGRHFSGSILTITWTRRTGPPQCLVEVIEATDRRFSNLLAACRQPASPRKSWGYV